MKVKSAVLLGRDDGESEAMVQVVDEEGSRVFKVVTVRFSFPSFLTCFRIGPDASV